MSNSHIRISASFFSNLSFTSLPSTSSLVNRWRITLVGITWRKRSLVLRLRNNVSVVMSILLNSIRTKSSIYHCDDTRKRTFIHRSLSRRTIRGVNRWTHRRISLERIPRVLNRLPLDSHLDRVVAFRNTPIYRYFLLVLSRYSRRMKRIAHVREHALSPLLYFPEASPPLGRWLLHHHRSSPPCVHLRTRKVPLVNLLFRLVIAIHRRQPTVSHRSASNLTPPDTFQLARDSVRCDFTSPMFPSLSSKYLTTTFFHAFLSFVEGITSF